MAQHLKALLTKNWILWKRNLLCSCCEIMLPTILIFALIGIRASIDKTDVPEISYTSQAGTLYPDLKKYPADSYFQITNSVPIIKNCKTHKVSDEYQRNGPIALIPPTSSIIQQMNGYFSSDNQATKFFDSLTDMNNYILDSQYGLIESKPFLCFGIEMMEDQNQQYTYALHYNTTGKPGTEDIPKTENDRTNPFEKQDIIYQYKWFDEGWLTIQNWMDNLILRQETKNQAFYIEAEVTSIKTPAFLDDEFPKLLKGAFSIYLVLPLMIIYLRMTYALLYEKEKKLREGMKMMGLNNSQFYLSWIITYFMIYTTISIISSVLLKLTVLPNTNIIVIWLVYWLFCMTLIFQSIFISVFFTRALFGLIVSIVFYLLQFIVISIVQSGGTNVPNTVLWIASFSSQAGLSFAFDCMVQFEGNQEGITFSSLQTQIANYSVSMNIIMSIANILFYLIVGLYLDQVFPNEWGKKKHPLFFLSCLRRQQKVKDFSYRNSSGSIQMDNRMEGVEAFLLNKAENQECVTINNLYKKYSSGKLAVSNLSLEMYQGQIFALLGHNGAGKTTTISMLTGMLDITSGNATAYGCDVSEDIDSIRKFMGVCPQHDILFDNLTVTEHLRMFATFKGMTDSILIEAEIKKMIMDVDLVEKTNYLAKNLSGGQKRKLSVAIAFMADSKLIYLDEPTSGMDTSARRYIWTMLKNYKSQRVVVLTTHFMDEADFLGDRIGIMGEGKLICCGSSVFLKNEFGVGYNLTMVKDSTNVDSNPIIRMVEKSITGSKVISNVSAEVTFSLPLGSVQEFPMFFDELDDSLKRLQISSYGISMTTLEEVFLRVAQIGAGHQQVDDFIKNEQSSSEAVDNFDINAVRVVDGFDLFLNHSLGLIKKRVNYFKRDLRSLACEILLPCVIVIAGLCLLTISFVQDSPIIFISASNFPWTPTEVSWGGQAGGQSYFEYFDSFYKVSKLDAQGTGQTQMINADQLYFEDYNIKEGLGWYFFNSVSDTSINYAIFGNTIQNEAYPMMMNEMNQAILRKATNNKQASITIVNSPFVLPIRVQSIGNTVTGFIAAFIFSIGMSFIPASVIAYVVKEREINIKHQQLVSGVSIYAYWLSNFLMDVGKHIIPAIFCALMVLAFNQTALLDGDNYGATWLLFFLYGWAIIPFCYIFSFLFKQQGNALLISFFMHLIIGALFSIIFWILRLIESTRGWSKKVAWVLRLFPSFSFSFGIINMSNITIYAAIEGYNEEKNVYDLDIAGGDILMLALEGFVYMILVFLLEKLENSGQIQKLGSGESDVLFQEKILDDDVIKENNQCQDIDPQTQAVLVRDVRKVYMLDGGNHKVAVDKVSFSVQNGEVFGLLGVNGAGKTTTFKMLSGEIKPSSGQAWIAGHSIIDNMEEARSNIGYCPQFDALLDKLTVQEHLNLFTVIKGIPLNLQSDLVNKKLMEMDLDRFRHQLSGTLSGGNKRKLSVAIAMIGNPPIVFLDEPSTGMDPEARRFMWNVISRIATLRKQSSIILTTHSMEEAEALSTKIAIQVEGNLRCIGSVQHIKNRFGSGYEIELKLTTPSDQKEILSKLSIPPNSRVEYEQALNILDQLKVSYMKDQITEEGYGSQIYIDLIKPLGISIEILLEFIQVELMGEEVMNFIQRELGPYDIIEHFQTFYRFRLTSNISVGSLFGQFEKNKQSLNISQYSIKQASIEQIFNNFATQQLVLVDAINEGKQSISIRKAASFAKIQRSIND